MKTLHDSAVDVLADARILVVLSDELAVRDIAGRRRELSDPGPDARARILTGLRFEIGPEAAAHVVAILDAIGWSATVDLHDDRLAPTSGPTALAWVIGVSAPVSLVCMLAGTSRLLGAALGAALGLALALVAQRTLEGRRLERVARREQWRWDSHFMADPVAEHAWSDETPRAETATPRSVVNPR